MSDAGSHATNGGPNGSGDGTSPNGHDQLVLLRPLGATTWLASADGDRVTARPAPVTGEPAEHHVTAPDDPHLVPFLGVTAVDDAPWLLSGLVAGTDLDRLLSIATLTPVQAATVALEVYAGLAALHAAGVGHGHVGTRAVLVGTDGTIQLADWAAGSWAVDGAGASLREVDLDAARGVVAALTRNADRPVVRRRPDHARLLSCLERLSAREPAPDAATADAEIRAAIRANTDVLTARRDVHAELAALVAAAERRRSVDATPRPSSVRVTTPPVNAPPNPVSTSGPLSSADWRRGHGQRRIWAVVAVVLLAGAALVAARGPIGSLVDRLTSRHVTTSTSPQAAGAKGAGAKGVTSTSNSAARRPAPRAVPALAPAAAGVVTGVALRALTTCRAGAPCPLRITVTVIPSAASRQVGWVIDEVNRCTGARVEKARGTLVAQPGWTAPWTTPTVRLSKASALALVAVTTSPDQAAAAPVLVPTHPRTC